VNGRGVKDEAVEVLQALIRLNTVNPPGAERAAIEYLRDHLAVAGFECELYAAEPERPNLVARLPGEEAGPVLGYLGHVDTVLASPEEWSHDPWSGDLAAGAVWGRGALDMKSQVAAEVVAAARMARGGWRPAHGELKVFCVADEEAGGRLGAQFLCREHPEAARCDYLINEGGGSLLPFDGRRLFGVCCAEKGVFRFTVTAEGVAGHASMPRMGDNALLKLAPLIERMREQPAFDLTDEPRALLEAVGEGAGVDTAAALERLRERDPALAFVVEPMLGVTIAPTKARASEKINVIPSRAQVQVDCRVPPGLGEPEARARVEEVLGPDGYRLEFDEQVMGNRSAMDTPLMEAVEEWVAEQEPDATVIPVVLPGFTDSRSWRAAFPDCVAYGFFPQRNMTLYETAPLYHAADERIDVRDLEWATEFFGWLAPRMLGGGSG
jgi:acetylornithine deacetylase/succinyl-diaminopimelate desuccinylase-like protein